MQRTDHRPSSGRIRLTILLATVAAFLLVPAAQAFANSTMTVLAEGTGSGEISSVGGIPEFGGIFEGSPPIECSYASPGPATGVCEDEATTAFGLEGVGVHAVAAPGSKFVKWSSCGGFPVEAECRSFVEEGANTEWVDIAVFCPEGEPTCNEVVGAEEFPLTVTKSGTGEGTVTSSPAGIECGSECEAEFEEGEEVELSQSPESDSKFTGWSGACTGTGTCKVTMTEAKEVMATFIPIPRTLTINEAGTGEGEVECKFDGGPEEACASPQPNGTTVEIIATPETGSEFAGFSAGTGSASSCSTSPCSFTIEANSSVTATFDLEPTPEFKLTVVKAGTGSGSVTCNVTACATEYPEGTELTLAASAASGSTFTGWSGAGCSGTAGCKVTIEEDTAVTATFTANPREEAKKEEPKPNLSPAEGTAKAAGTATVKSGKAELKLNCSGGPCKGTVQLTAKVKQGKKTRSLVIGKASFSLADGASTTLKVKLSGPAKQELAKGKTLKAKVGGTDVGTSTVKLKSAKKAHWAVRRRRLIHAEAPSSVAQEQ